MLSATSGMLLWATALLLLPAHAKTIDVHVVLRDGATVSYSSNISGTYDMQGIDLLSFSGDFTIFPFACELDEGVRLHLRQTNVSAETIVLGEITVVKVPFWLVKPLVLLPSSARILDVDEYLTIDKVVSYGTSSSQGWTLRAIDLVSSVGEIDLCATSDTYPTTDCVKCVSGTSSDHRFQRTFEFGCKLNHSTKLYIHQRSVFGQAHVTGTIRFDDEPGWIINWRLIAIVVGQHSDLEYKLLSDKP
eukprot:m51a1_g3919 hypothetical protein (247) ;mRNA; r:175325-177000